MIVFPLLKQSLIFKVLVHFAEKRVHFVTSEIKAGNN